jgi:uncharacterized protein
MAELPGNKKSILWGPVTAVLGTIVLFIGVQLIVGLFIGVILTGLGWSESKIDLWFSGGNTSQFILSAVSAFTTISLLFVYLYLKHAHPSDIGLVRPRLRDIGYVLAGAAVYICTYLLIVNLISGIVPSLNTEQTQDLGFTATQAGSGLILVFISLVVLPPLVEEIVVRGFMYTGLRSKMPFIAAALISSSVFGLAHLLGGEGGSTIWIAVIDTFVLGMVLAYLREKSGSLWPAIGLHALKNFTAFIFLFVIKTL